MKKRVPAEFLGRLAMRVEGKWWVAYTAPLGTMEGAFEIGRIRMTAAEAMRDEALAFFRTVFAALVMEASGVKVEWPNGPVTAPEHEKAGRA